MFKRALEFAKRPGSKNVVINTLGNYLNVAFTAFFALILVRILSPAQYGVLSVLLGIAYVLANVLDFGVTATIYSYLPALLEKRSERTYQFIKTNFVFQSTLSFTVILILFFIFPYLDQVFFKTKAPTHELYLTAISVLFLIWQNFVLNILYAAKKFWKANIYNNLQNLLKTLVLISLAIKGAVTVGGIIFIFGIFGPLIFFLFLFIERRDLLFILAKSKIKKGELRFSYTLTYFIATQLFNLGNRMDLFLLSYFGLRNDVGFYGLAQKVILTIVTTVISITQVIAPNFSKVKSKIDARREFRHGFLYLLIPAGLFLILALVPKQIFDLFFTEKFGPTAQLAKSLIPAYILFTFGVLPLQFILYTAKKPIYPLLGNLMYFIFMTVGCYLLIPKMGVFAAPLMNLFALLGPGLVLIWATIREYNKLPNN